MDGVQLPQGYSHFEEDQELLSMTSYTCCSKIRLTDQPEKKYN